MPLLTAGQIAGVEIELLTRQLVLPMTVARVNEQDFEGSNGDTVTIRVPAAATSRVQASPSAPITYDPIDETGVALQVAHIYHAKRVSDQEMNYTIENFARQIGLPQSEAVAVGAEDRICTVFNGLASELTFDVSPTEANTKAELLEGRRLLNAAFVPFGRRTLAVSPEIAVRLLSVSDFVRQDAIGSPSGLREATIGRIYGFDVVESPGLTAATAVMYHASAVGFATLTPVRPRGAVDSATIQSQGVGLRHLIHYDPDVLSDASVVSVFAGAALTNGARVVKFTVGA